MYDINQINVAQDILPAIYMKDNDFLHKIFSLYHSFLHLQARLNLDIIIPPTRHSVLFKLGCHSFWLFSYSNKGCNYLTIKGRKAGKQNIDFSLENKTRKTISWSH